MLWVQASRSIGCTRCRRYSESVNGDAQATRSFAVRLFTTRISAALNIVAPGSMSRTGSAAPAMASGNLQSQDAGVVRVSYLHHRNDMCTCKLALGWQASGCTTHCGWSDL